MEKKIMAKKQTKTTGKQTASGKPDPASVTNQYLTQQLEEAMRIFITREGIGENLTGTQRRRLFSAGVRNYGFIDKAFDIAQDNPSFMPPHFDVNVLYDNLRDLEDLRQLMLVLQQ